LVSGDDYPAAALRIRAQGTVRASLRVSPQGQVTDCTIDGSSGSALLDAATCRMLTARTGFAPARNRRGRPVFDIATAGVRWLIPVDWKPTLPEALRGSPH
jgi:protein TonB